MEKFDCFYGKVTGGNKAGVYITSDTGSVFFAFYGGIPLGERVLCTFLKEGGENRYPRVSIDSIISYNGLAA